MHYAGILVISRPGAHERCLEDLQALPGVEVHLSYPESCRLIAVQETETVRGQEEGFRAIQALSTVETAALVEHRIDPPDVRSAEPDAGAVEEEPP